MFIQVTLLQYLLGDSEVRCSNMSLGGGGQSRPRTCWGDYISQLECLGVHAEELVEWVDFV